MERKAAVHELLTIFMEECAEATVEASKLIRFGDVNTKSAPLETELGDLMCMVRLLEDYGLIDPVEVARASVAKREKLKTWSNLSLD